MTYDIANVINGIAVIVFFAWMLYVPRKNR
jgi:uncharacterized membrane protein